MEIKITGPNGGDAMEYWRGIKLAAGVQISDALKGGRFVRDKILELTSRGVDYSGAPFAPYTRAWAKKKGSDQVNLSYSGRMLSKLKFSVNGRVYESSARGTSKEPALSMGIGIYDSPKDAMKGRVHNQGQTRRVAIVRGGVTLKGRLKGGVMDIPKRNWLNASAATVQGAQQVMIDSMGARVKDAI